MVLKDDVSEKASEQSNNNSNNIDLDKLKLIKFIELKKNKRETKYNHNLNKLISCSESLLLNDSNLIMRNQSLSSNNEQRQSSHKISNLNLRNNSTSSLKDEYLTSSHFNNKISKISINTLNDDNGEDDEKTKLDSDEFDEDDEDEIALSSSLSTSSEESNATKKRFTKPLKASPSISSSENSKKSNKNNASLTSNSDSCKKLSISSCVSTTSSSFEPSSPSMSLNSNSNDENNIKIDSISNFDENDLVNQNDLKMLNNRCSDMTMITNNEENENKFVNEEDDDDESRRDTIIFLSKKANENENDNNNNRDEESEFEKSLKEFQLKNKLKEENINIIIKSSASESQITLTSSSSLNQLKEAIITNQSENNNSKYLACEVASLSSLTSTYSQFDFTSSSINNNNNIQSSVSYNNQFTNQNKSSNQTSSSITSFFFSNGLFFNKNKQTKVDAIAEDKSTVELKSNKPIDQPKTHTNSNATTPNKTKFDLASKLFSLKPSSLTGNFNLKSSSSSSNTTSNSTFKFIEKNTTNKEKEDSSSSSSTSSNSNENLSIRTNHSFNNLVASDFQLPSSVLIFENRPSNLPAKSQQEALKHKQEYERMVEIAKKKEKKEKELQLKKQAQQIKKEDFMTNSLKIWNSEILANWDELKNAKRTKSLWWHGLPPPIRGKVWKLAIGNDANLNKESYFFYEKKAKEKLEQLNQSKLNADNQKENEQNLNLNESSVEMIKLDVSRTFPHLCFFQKDGPYHEALFSVLGAYACYNTKIGYVQGMSFLTAILLLNMEAPDAFICLSNLLQTKYLYACFCMDQTKMNRYFRVHQILLQHNIPKLYEHFEEQKVKPDLYLIEWIFTLFSKSLPLDVMSRVWDVFFRDKEEFLFKASLGILNMYKDTLLGMDFIHIVQFLTKLPENINATQLFKSIEQIQLSIDDVYFTFDHLVNEIINEPSKSLFNNFNRQ